MPHSEEFGLEEDNTEFIVAATQVETAENVVFEPSPRPTKRRRIKGGIKQASDEFEWSQTDDESSLPARPPSATTTGEYNGNSDEPEEDADYYFPGEVEGDLQQAAKNSKYKIHVPKAGGQYDHQVFTQTQVDLDSSPSHFRGAVWKKPKPPPPPVFGETAVNANGNVQVNGRSGAHGLGSKRTVLNNIDVFARPSDIRSGDTYRSDADLAARLQARENSLGRSGQNASRHVSPSDSNASFDVAQELADLPSDAFLSSPEGSPGKEVITISSQITTAQQRTNGLCGPQRGLKQMTIFGQPATQDLSASQAATKKHAWPLKSRDEPPTHHKLDERAMETWVYPTNLGNIRDYQYNIVSRSLFHNTLVALPTGLGKTFIAATVMLNYYRWTENAQVVFMAPTKPLIAQQMEACYHIVGIPRRDTVLMTGETTPGLRAEEWLERRVFFMTPQTVINDLKTGICDPKKIVLIVVDEAHKATGAYAYTEVIKFMRRFNNSFRVYALTATPGSSVEAVQAVIDNIGIARVELRTEQSLDIRAYTHEKLTETELFEHSDEQVFIMDLMSKALRPVLEKLCSQNAYWSRDPMQLSAYGLTIARQKWMGSDAGRKAAMPVKGMVNSTFTLLSGLAHGIGLLKNHGIGPFYSTVLEFQKNVESGQMRGKNATQIAQSEDFNKMMRLIRGWTNNADFIGHPKLQYLREVVLNHFLDAGEGRQGSDVPPSATRVMIFASYRDSTEEICRVLKRNEPMIRPHAFVGQAASKGSEGMDQKRQSAVIQDFKSGKYNTLVATSIGEEGLDIGDVDLIVCYDASSSPIRMLQRIGRTGRKRVGRVVLLLMKGKEENDYAKAQDNYIYIQKTIADASKYSYRDDQSPRILPKGTQPVVDKRVVEIPVDNSQPIDTNERNRKAKGKQKVKKPPKKFNMPDGVRAGFVKASKMGSDDNGEDSEELNAPEEKALVRRKSTPARRKQAIQPEPEPVQLPFLEDVLLNSVQEKELERKYAYAAETDAERTVRPPDPTRFPDVLRDTVGMKYMRHGRASDVVSRTMRAVHEVDDEVVKKMKDIVDISDLQDFGSAKMRLASPIAEADSEDVEILANAICVPKSKKAPKRQPRKKQTLQHNTSIRFATTLDADHSDPKPATKKPRGRPRKKRNVQRSTSYGSAAAEGNESSPEPTPANMRIGTQGIDLGSMDTSGEDDDEQPESELEDFIVKSDQPIEMASSSQRLPDDAQPSGQLQHRGKGLTNGAARNKESLHQDANESEAESDLGLAELASFDAENDSEVEEIPAPIAAAPNGRKRRVITGSDSDE